VPIVLKSGSLNLLESSGPVQACSRSAFLMEHAEDLIKKKKKQRIVVTGNKTLCIRHGTSDTLRVYM
jgi:hypothetical protein